MPHYRFIIRGDWHPGRSDYAGFFTTRAAKGPTLAAASASMLEKLSSEWREHAPIECGGKNARFSIVDGWRLGILARWRGPNAGHTFFRTVEEEADAASLEAKASRAPADASIWCIATPSGNITSEMSLMD